MVARDVFDGESGGHCIDLDFEKVRERKGEHEPLCEDVVEREGQKCLELIVLVAGVVCTRLVAVA